MPTSSPTSGSQTISSGGSGSTQTVESNSVTVFTPPSGAVGFLIMNIAQDSGPAVRWRVGSNPTSSQGQRLESGRDGVYYQFWAPIINVIAEEGSALVDVQWVLP